MSASHPELGNARSRARLACDRCRKKKAKCPGEQPACSLCLRLNQQCTYAQRPDNFREFRVSKPANARSHEERLRRLETNLDRISGLESRIDQLFNGNNASPASSRISQETPVDPRPSLSIEHQREALDVFPVPPDLLAAVIDIYFDHVECQPLPLLIRKGSFDFADEVAFGIIAVAARYSTHPYFGRDESSPQVFNQKARAIIFKALETDDATLSTVQAACLISLADYLDGLVQRANLNVGIATRLAYALDLLKPRRLDEISEDESVSRCCWSLFALERLFSLASGAPMPLLDQNHLPGYPSSPEVPPSVRSSPGATSDTLVDLGILAYCLQLIGVWGEVIKHVMHHKQSGSSQLPWTADSEYNRIMSRFLSYEAVFANQHRWWLVNFPQQDPADLKTHRPYWGPWLLMQFLFHSCLALLHHPVLFLSGVTTTFTQLPPSFAQTASNHAQLHSRWIAHFADLLRLKDLEVTDPFLAYGASIAATIHAFYAGSKNEEVSLRAKKDFSLCLLLVRDLSVKLPSIQYLAHRLEHLQQNSPALNGLSRDHEGLSLIAYADIFWSIAQYSNPPKVHEDSSHVGQNDVRFIEPPSQHPEGSSSSQNQVPEDPLAVYLGVFPPFACPELVQSFDEWSVGNL